MANAPTFAVASRDKIQGYIDAGVLVYPSYVLCKNTYEWVYIDKELQMQNIKGYAQASMFVVDELPTENIQDNTFYLREGIGYLSINGKLVPVFKDISDNVESYNDLADVPIINKVGTIGDEVTLANLDDGSYSISGHYKISESSQTINIIPANVMFLIESDEDYKYITKLGAKKTIVYKVDIASGEVIEDTYITQSWIEEQGYTTKNYVDEAIEALYEKLASDALVSITKVSQLENDMGYLTADNLEEISQIQITNLF